MARILLIDDDPDLLDMVSMALEEAGHELLCAADGQAGLERFRDEPVNVVISDVNMPRMDGFTLCRKLREAGERVPLILLTSREGEIDEALGLDLGADDYIVKPVSARVLLARIGALLRREALGDADSPETKRCVGNLVLDPARICVTWRDQEVTTTVTEFRMLEALVRHPGVVLSRDRLLEEGRGDDSVVDGRLVDTYIRRLRRKLEGIDPEFNEIETVIGAGYRWRDGLG